jgi:hypothetical protein
MATTYMCRLFGGRDVGVTWDGVNIITILGQALSVATLPTSLQAQFASAVANAPATMGAGARPAFGGDNLSAVIGSIMDNQPTWRNAVQAALSRYVSSLLTGNLSGDPEAWNR